MTRVRKQRQSHCSTSAHYALLSTPHDLTTVCRILRTESEGRDIFLSRSCDESEDESEDISDEDSAQWD